MKKLLWFCIPTAMLTFVLFNNEIFDNKTANLSMVYAVTALIAFGVLACYTFLSRKKDFWYTVLLSSVFVVNLGYLWLSVSDTLGNALMANRLSYLGSVFLPLSMLMIMLDAMKIKCKRLVVMLLLGIGGVVFLIAASPGYLDIYYKEVYLVSLDGFSVLKKVYGPLHGVYLVYLVGYFSAMVYTIIYALRKKTLENKVHTFILVMAVFINIGLWFIEQLVNIGFELLSVSYIISELFLLGLNILIAEQNRLKEQISELGEENKSKTAPIIVDKELLQLYKNGLASLTKTERLIYDAYLEGKSTKDVMSMLGITENTLKFHNKNIYGKLGVASRKQLVEFSKSVKT